MGKDPILQVNIWMSVEIDYDLVFDEAKRLDGILEGPS